MRALLSSAVVLSLFVFACSGSDQQSDGGNGKDASDDSNADNPDGSTIGPDGGGSDAGVVTPPGPAYGTKCMMNSANETKATDEVAIVRGKAKLPPMNCVDGAQQASRNHSGYIAQNGWALTHVESMGKPGFTGVNFWDRMKYAGYSGSAMFEVVHSVADAHEAITGKDGWINTLYHRIPFVDFTTRDFGFGAMSGGGQTSTMDFGRGNMPPKDAITTWPANGDTGVWTTFHNAYESPNPLPSQQVAGYPISVSGGSALMMDKHEITTGGNAVDHVVIDAVSDQVKLVPPTQVYFIPRSPLKPNTTYNAHFTGSVGGAAFDVTTSFTTGAQ